MASIDAREHLMRAEAAELRRSPHERSAFVARGDGLTAGALFHATRVVDARADLTEALAMAEHREFELPGCVCVVGEADVCEALRHFGCREARAAVLDLAKVSDVGVELQIRHDREREAPIDV